MSTGYGKTLEECRGKGVRLSYPTPSLMIALGAAAATSVSTPSKAHFDVAAAPCSPCAVRREQLLLEG